MLCLPSSSSSSSYSSHTHFIVSRAMSTHNMTDIQKIEEVYTKHAESLSLQDVPLAERTSHEKKSKQERRLLLKMDMIILPLLTLSFLMAYLVCTL